MTRRVARDQCCGAIIDVQSFFLSQLDKRAASRLKRGIGNFARLLGCLQIPVIATLERPIGEKGALPGEIDKRLPERTEIFEKDFFDLTRERRIRDRLRSLKRKQVIIAGCETDVCVLQSCLGLLDLGCEVYVLEDLIFSASSNVDSAIARMKAAGAIFLTYKTLYYELIEAVGRAPDDTDELDALEPMSG
jgi:nicotinamidase-related amidase